MNQIVLVEDRKELHDLLKLNLTTSVKAEVIPKTNAAETIELLDLLPDISLIVCRDAVTGDKTALDILGYLTQHGLDTKVIVLGNIPKDFSERADSVQDPKSWKEVIEKANALLGNTTSTQVADSKDGKIPIPANYFLYLESSCCDVYLQIKKDKFIKIIHGGDSFSREKINEYMKQDLKYLYIPDNMVQNFTNFVSDRLVEKVDALSAEVSEKNIHLSSHAHTVVTRQIMEVGLNSATVQLADSVISNIIKVFEQSPELGSLLRTMMNSQSGHMYKHCYMTFALAAQILDTLKLSNKDVYKTIGYAAFFHDICFTENEEHAKLTSFEELEKAGLSKEEYDLVVNHAIKAHDLFLAHPDAPKDAAGLIKTHHGSPKGVGFSVTDFSELSGTEKIFFISCEFAKEFLTFERKKGEKPVPITHKLRKKYFDPEISKAITALEKALQKGMPKK